MPSLEALFTLTHLCLGFQPQSSRILYTDPTQQPPLLLGLPIFFFISLLFPVVSLPLLHTFLPTPPPNTLFQFLLEVMAALLSSKLLLIIFFPYSHLPLQLSTTQLPCPFLTCLEEMWIFLPLIPTLKKQRQNDIYDFKSSLVSIFSFRTSRDTLGETVSRTQSNKLDKIKHKNETIIRMK